jgi:hypothetical protein
MTVNEKECAAAGLDPDDVKSLARRLEGCGMTTQRLGLTIFGGSGGGDLRSGRFRIGSRAVIVAHIAGNCWDGGCGACSEVDGLECGE